jgi:hypothetical protein
MWSHQVTGWLVNSSFCPQFSLQLGGDVSLPIHIGWSELLLFSPGVALQLQLCLVSSPAARWSNSVLNSALCPIRSALGSTTCPTLGGWPVTLPFPPPHSQPCVPPLISAQCYCLLWEVGLPLHPGSQPLLLDLHSFLESLALRVQLLVPSQFSRADSAFYSHLHCWCYIIVRCLCCSVLFWGGVQSSQGQVWIIFLRGC